MGSSTDGLFSGNRRATAGPRQQRRRSLGLVTLAALLVLVTGLAVAAWGVSAGEKESVLAVGGPIAKGQQIDREDLVSRSVSGVPDAIVVADARDVVGQTAAVDLVDGQILTTAMLTSSAVPESGQAVIGLALDPARVPGAGLDAGDVVDVIAVPASEAGQGDLAALDAPEVLAAAAPVFDVGGDSTAGGQVLVTLIVDASRAARVASYSTQNRVAIVETSPADLVPTGGQ